MDNQTSLVMDQQINNGNFKPLSTLSAVLRLDQSSDDWNLSQLTDAEEDGRREYLAHVNFVSPFNNVPLVHLGLTGFDIDKQESARISVEPTNITSYGFIVKVETWSNTRVYSVDINWLAIGA